MKSDGWREELVNEKMRKEANENRNQKAHTTPEWKKRAANWRAFPSPKGAGRKLRGLSALKSTSRPDGRRCPKALCVWLSVSWNWKSDGLSLKILHV